MNNGFGIESPPAHHISEHRATSRWLIIIDSGGPTIVRMFLDSREPVAEFDAGIEEIAQMVQGLTETVGASGPEWDAALAGHNADERAKARVYRLDI